MSAKNLSLDYLYCFHQVESLTWHIFSLFTYRLDMVGIQQTFLPVISWTVPHDDQSGDRSLFPLLQVKVLRSMRVLSAEDVVVGQYKSHTRGGVKHPGYTEDETVPNHSLTPTFAAAALFIDNARWDGVPFLMKAGKALHTKRLVLFSLQSCMIWSRNWIQTSCRYKIVQGTCLVWHHWGGNISNG